MSLFCCSSVTSFAHCSSNDQVTNGRSVPNYSVFHARYTNRSQSGLWEANSYYLLFLQQRTGPECTVGLLFQYHHTTINAWFESHNRHLTPEHVYFLLSGPVCQNPSQYFYNHLFPLLLYLCWGKHSENISQPPCPTPRASNCVTSRRMQRVYFAVTEFCQVISMKIDNQCWRYK